MGPLLLAAALISTDTVVPLLPAPTRVEIAPGRSLSLVCVGAGRHTILFDAGGSDWSLVWATILPRLADRARVCAYDRAGLGASDPAAGARTPMAIVQDLHSLVEAADLKGPLVLVGHSLGGFNVKLHAALYPKDVAGLVLVDPSDERDWDRTRAWAVKKYGAVTATEAELLDRSFIAGLMERYRRCATISQPNGLDPASLDYRRCSDPPRPALGDQINAERHKVQSTAIYQAAQASEILNSVYGGNQSDKAYAQLFRPGMFGRKPLVVLTHVEESSADPVDQLGAEQGLRLHEETARLSLRGRHQAVRKSGHYIQLDQPEVLLQAIRGVLDQLKKD
jgi:pimeloyl-ACP methyl ester carboxylesterase